MISLLPSTQLLLALWLLATVAPAATALLNGSVMPFAVAETKSKVAARESTTVLVSESNIGKDETPVGGLACDCEIDNRPYASPNLSVESFRSAGDTPPARCSSVLQTELQRHRPKVA